MTPGGPAPDRPDATVFALELRGVSKIYGSGNTAVTAVAQASTGLRAGEMVALLGPSGSGKSTLLLMAGLLEQPTRGEVRLRGLRASGPAPDIADLRAFRRSALGFVFQKPNLVPFLSALQNVQLALEIDDQPPAAARQRADELLRYLDVGHRRHNRPDQLSGGEQQRVAIARALANRPFLVLADEPTAALDSSRARQAMRLFRQLAHELRTTVLVVTHDHRSLDLFDRVLEMNDGHLEERALPPA